MCKLNMIKKVLFFTFFVYIIVRKYEIISNENAKRDAHNFKLFRKEKTYNCLTDVSITTRIDRTNGRDSYTTWNDEALFGKDHEEGVEKNIYSIKHNEILLYEYKDENAHERSSCRLVSNDVVERGTGRLTTFNKEDIKENLFLFIKKGINGLNNISVKCMSNKVKRIGDNPCEGKTDEEDGNADDYDDDYDDNYDDTKKRKKKKKKKNFLKSIIRKFFLMFLHAQEKTHGFVMWRSAHTNRYVSREGRYLEEDIPGDDEYVEEGGTDNDGAEEGGIDNDGAEEDGIDNDGVEEGGEENYDAEEGGEENDGAEEGGEENDGAEEGGIDNDGAEEGGEENYDAEEGGIDNDGDEYSDESNSPTYELQGMEDQEYDESSTHSDYGQEGDISMSLQDLNDDIDKVNEAFEVTISGEEGVPSLQTEQFSSNNTNKEYVCDFTEQIKPIEEKSKVKNCNIKITDPLGKIKIICPVVNSEEKSYKSIEYFPKKAPFVTLYIGESKGGNEKLKEKKLSELIYGILIPPKVNEKKNDFEQGSIEFILPPMVDKQTTIYFICDNSKSTDDDKKGNRGVAEITIEPYGKLIKGCDYSEQNKTFFQKKIDIKNSTYPCLFQLNSGDIGGIMFPGNTKSTTCFEEMIQHTNHSKWDKKKKSLTELINSAVIYNKDRDEKYFNVKYVHIPSSFRDSLSLFCTITLNDDSSFLVYVGINHEINMSLFELLGAFHALNKINQVAVKTQGKEEFTCDFTDVLDTPSSGGEEKKVIICKKNLKEFDIFKMKCNMDEGKYKDMEMLPKTLKTKKDVYKFEFDIQYHFLKKYMNFHMKNAQYYNEYPSLFVFPFNKIAKNEIKKNALLKNHKNAKYFEESFSSTDTIVHMLTYLDSQDIIPINEHIRYLNVDVNDSDSSTLDVTIQIPPYIETNQPFYFLMGCNNSKAGGNIGVVELLISKNEQKIKGCNFHPTKVDYFSENIESSTNECTVDAYKDDIIGLNCLNTIYTEEEDSTNISLDPEDCFKNVYENNLKKDMNEILGGVQVYNINGKATPTFLKIPVHNKEEDIKVSCKCTVNAVVKEMKIIIKKATNVDDEKNLKKEINTVAINEDDLYICENKTYIEPALVKWDDKNIEHICTIEATEFLSYVEIFCPSKDFLIYENINIMYNTIKPTKEDELKIFTQKELEKFIPHSELLHKTRGMIDHYKQEKVDLSHLYIFFPYYIKEEHEFRITCDNSNTHYNNKKGTRVIYNIKIPKREKKKIKGCDFSESSKAEIFENVKDGEKCTVDASTKDIVGFVCPSGTVKLTSCFRDAIVNDNVTSFLVYVGINHEINMSLFELLGAFHALNKINQVAVKTQGKEEFTCDFTDVLDTPSSGGEEKKVIICKKNLKEFDIFKMKCNMDEGKYKDMEMLPKTLKTKKDVYKFEFDIQYHFLKKYMNFHMKNAQYYNEYPSLFVFPFNKIAKNEIKKNALLKNHKNAKYFEESFSSTDTIVHMLTYLDSQDIIPINEHIRYLNVDVNDSDSSTLDVTIQIPPYIETNQPFYFLMGCNNSKAGGNIGVVELLISKNEQKIKGCNFHPTKVDYFSENIESSTNECTVDAYKDDIIGLNCLNTIYTEEEDSTNISLDPEDCFKNVYENNLKKDMNEILGGVQVYNINGKATPTFLKIPVHNKEEDIKVSCKCTVNAVVKEMKIIIKKATNVDDEKNLKKEINTVAINEDDLYICENKTYIEPALVKWDDKNIEHICTIEATEFLSYVEIFCPSKDFLIYENINIMYNTIKPTKEDELKIFTQKELEKFIPHSELLHKTRGMIDHYKQEKVDLSHLYIFFPYYIKEEHEFRITCDNSNTHYNNKKGTRVIYNIKIPKREKKKIKGCDFSESSKAEIFENVKDGEKCTVDASTKDIVGFVCPSGTVKLTSCFRDAIVNDNVTNISHLLNLKNNMANYTYKHQFNYIEIPVVTSADLTFKCICVYLGKNYNVKAASLSPTLLDIIYKKMKIKKDDYNKGVASKKKYVMSTMNMYLSHKANTIISLFNEIENKRKTQSDENPDDIIDALAASDTCNYSSGFGSDPNDGVIEEVHKSLDEYDSWENIYDEEIEKEITTDIQELEQSAFKIYTLEVNLKAPKLMKPVKVGDNIHVCDFSKKNLLISNSAKGGIETDIHCYTEMKPLDVLYVKCPTGSDAYVTAKAEKEEEEHDELQKEVIALIGDVKSESTLALEIDSTPLDDSTFEKCFTKFSLKPKNFFEMVINEEEEDDKEVSLSELLPGVIYSSMKVLKKKDPFTSYAGIVIPPIISKDTSFKVHCNNTEYKEIEKYAGYNGITHIHIAKSEPVGGSGLDGGKIKGCDFSSSASSILTESIELVNGETKECTINIRNNEPFGIICSKDTTLYPETCFHQIYDKSENVKSFKEIIPNSTILTLQNSNKKIAYGKIPQEYVNKFIFSCSCKKSDDNTKGTMKVTINKDATDIDELKAVTANTHDKTNVCNFYDNEDLSLISNPGEVVLCKVEGQIFTEVIVQLPVLGEQNTDKEEYKKFSLIPPLDLTGDDIKVMVNDRTEVSLSTALKGVYGNRVFTFEKKGVKGQGLSFFIPPTTEDVNLKISINEKKDSSEAKQRGLIHISIKKNIEVNSETYKVCDFTKAENNLTELNNPLNNEKECNVKIKKGDILGIICPKGFTLFPQACFSNILLEYYKSSPEDDEDINYISNIKYDLKLKEILYQMKEDNKEDEQVHNYYSYSSNILEKLNFENYNLGNIPLDYKNHYTSSYAKVPNTFNSILNFSCNCYSPLKNVFGTMNVQTENVDFESLDKKKIDLVEKVFFPYKYKVNADLEEEKREPFIATQDYTSTSTGSYVDITQKYPNTMLGQSVNYSCDYSDESLFSLVEGKLQRNMCKINAKGLDIVTIKCLYNKDVVLKDTSSGLIAEDKKVIVTIDEKEYITHINDKNNSFTLKEIYVKNFYGVSQEELKKLRKLEEDWQDYHIFYPPKGVEEVIVDNTVVKLVDALPGVLFLKNKSEKDQKIKTTKLPIDGIASFLVPPYVHKDLNFQIFCGKSSSKKPKKKDTSLGIVHVHISANKNVISGCDFINEQNSPNSFLTHKKNEKNELMCEIPLISNTVVGLNCPKGKLQPVNCFNDMYYIEDGVEEVNATADKYDKYESTHKVKTTSVIEHAIPINNVDDKESTYSYLVLPNTLKNIKELNKVFICTCDKNIVKMKIDENFVNKESNIIGESNVCTYDHSKKVSTCNIISSMQMDELNNTSLIKYTANISRWDKLIIKYPTNKKLNYEKCFLNPLNIKEKVLYHNIPTNIEDILPGAIVSDKYDSRTNISEYILRIPPYVPKSVEFSIEFNNKFSSITQNQKIFYGNMVKIYINVNQGYKEVSGCDFTGNYAHLFSQSYIPTPNEVKECTITFGNNSFAGFACLSNYQVEPDNCFTSVYDNTDSKRVKKITDLSGNSEHDQVKQNTLGYTLSYITLNDEPKKLNFSCTCVSSYSTYTINILYEPQHENSTLTTRSFIKYFNSKTGAFSKYLRKP
ncbi:6-cysteine protein, putative [Plasmodium malariae]|uniref:6-cysteine protein, putative n=1 Tax=Plasmodium malariae TaxID=5858 RepID=A0A1C3KAM3_PLAMA|nr:6-cysteine protein, putative [Plasmodium malariae]